MTAPVNAYNQFSTDALDEHALWAFLSNVAKYREKNMQISRCSTRRVINQT